MGKEWHPNRVLNKFSLCWCIVLVLCLYAGLLSSDSGRTQLLALHGDIHITIAKNPWMKAFPFSPIEKVVGALSGFLLFMPVFVADESDQVRVMQRLQSINGDMVPFFHGVALTRHEDVTAVMASQQQRQWLLGAFQPSPGCLPSDTLIFVPNGANHTRIRSTISKLVKGLQVTPRGFKLSMLPAQEDLRKQAEKLYALGQAEQADKLMDVAWKKTLVATVFERMFELALTQEQVDAIAPYMDKAPGACVLDASLWPLTEMAGLGAVRDIRKLTTELVTQSPVGQRAKGVFQDAYVQAFGSPLPPAAVDGAVKDFLRQLSDGFLFAGLLGSSSLASALFKRVRSDVRYHMPLWNANKPAYLLESARVNPAVTWFSTVRDTPFHASFPNWFGSPTTVTYPAGTPIVYFIGTANQDKVVFGGPGNSAQRAGEFDPTRDTQGDILTWNGPEAAWAGGSLNTSMATRGCPGRELSKATVMTLLDTFAPQLPPGYLPDGSLTPDGDYNFSHIPVMDNFGWLVWTGACFACIAWLSVVTCCLQGTRTFGPATGNYVGYLAAQGMNGIVWNFLGNESVFFYHLQNLAAVFYARIFLQAVQYWGQRRRLLAAQAHVTTKRSVETMPSMSDSSPSRSPGRGAGRRRKSERSAPVDADSDLRSGSGSPLVVQGGALQDGTVMKHAASLSEWPIWASFGFVTLLIQYAHAVDPHFNLQLFASMYYMPAAACVMYTVTWFWWCKGYDDPVIADEAGGDDSRQAYAERQWDRCRGCMPRPLQRAMPPTFEGFALWLGFIGGFWGVADLFWPNYLASGQAFHLLSRLGDSILYIPAVIHAIPVMDDLMQQTNIASQRILAGGRILWKPGHAQVSVQMTPTRSRRFRRLRADCSCWTILAGAAAVMVASLGLWLGVSFLENMPLCNWGTANIDPLGGVDAPADFTCPNGIFPVSRQEAKPLPADSCSPALNSKFHKLDLNAKLLYQALSKGVLDAQGPTPNGSVVPRPRWHRRLKKQVTVFGVPIPIEDEDAGASSSSFSEGFGDFAQQLLRSTLIFGDAQEADLHLAFADAAESVSMLDASTRAKTRLPPTLMPWPTMLTDDAVAKIAFVGMGAHAITRLTPAQRKQWGSLPGAPGDLTGCEFVSDFTWMSGLETRGTFERYGAAAFFDDNGDVVGIVWNAAPNAESLAAGAWFNPRDGLEWDRAKFVWRSSLVVGVTLRDHLVGLHATLSNAAVTATRENLPTTHPLRRLLTPFTYKTVWINKGSIATLLSRNGMLHRAVALSWNGMKQAFRYSYENVVFANATAQIAARGMDDVPEWLYPWGADTRRFDRIVHNFVSEYVAAYYGRGDECRMRVLADDDLHAFDDGLHAFSRTMLPHIHDCASLVTVLSTIIVKVTASHLQFGRVSAYVSDAGWAASKLEPYDPKDSNLAGLQTAFQMNGIAMITAKAQPMLMANFDHLLTGTKTQLRESKAAWHTFREDLCRLSNAIDAQNALAQRDTIPLLPLPGRDLAADELVEPNDGRPRRFPCNSVNPKFMSSAVSI